METTQAINTTTAKAPSNKVASKRKKSSQAREPLIQNEQVISIFRNKISQAKLQVGQPNDPFEQEADRVAEQVIKQAPETEAKNLSHLKAVEPTTIVPKAITPKRTAVDIQRVCTQCEEEVQLKADDEVDEYFAEGPTLLEGQQLTQAIQSIRQAGSALNNREFFEQRMGFDFSETRVHTDARANQLATQLGAKAFTHGADIVFGPGQYNPQSTSGKRLLAHELTHVVQQGAAAPIKENTAVHKQNQAPKLQAGLLDDAETLWDSGTSFIADTAVSTGRAIGRGARTVGRAVVRGAEAIGDLAVDAFDSVRDFVMAYLEEYAPGLLAFMRGDIIGTVKEKILEGLDYLFNGFGTRIQEEGLVGALTGVFGEFTGTVKQIATDMAAGNCDSLFSAIESIAGFGERLLGPAFDELRALLGMAGDYFGELWNKFGSPAWDAIKDLAGSAWTWISDQAKWLWDQTAGIRSMASYIWEEYKRIFNLEWNAGEGSVTGWLRDKATEAWNEIKEALGPMLLPLQIAAAVFLLFTPMAPVVAIGVGVPLLWQAIGWLRENWDSLDIVIRAREVLANDIMPALQSGLAAIQGFLQEAATWLNEQVASITSAITNLLAALGLLPILRTLASVVGTFADKVVEACAWIGNEFSELLQDLKGLAAEYLKIMQPIAVLLIAIINFPVFPWMLAIVLSGWAWRALPDCLKPPIIDFWLATAIGFVNAMPDFELFGPAWPEAKKKIIETLQTLQGMDTESKIEGSNRIAKMMTGEDFTWIANLARAAWQMPNHFMGQVEEELIGHDLNTPLPIERLPEDALLADSGMPIDAAATLLGKDRLTAEDVEVEPIANTLWHPDLIRDMSIPDGGERYLGDTMPEDIASTEGIAAELEAAEGTDISPEEASAEGIEGLEEIPEDPEAQLEHLANKPMDMDCDQKEKKEEPAAAAEVPAFARRYGPFTAMQRFRYLMNQMGKGISKWFDCNKHWLVPTLTVAIIALIAAVILTEGAALGVLASILEIVAAIMIGVSLVRMSVYVGKYITQAMDGKIAQGAKSLARGIAIGSIELVFALLFSLGPIIKAAKGGVGAALKATGRAAKSAVVPGFEATTKLLGRGGKSAARAGTETLETGVKAGSEVGETAAKSTKSAAATTARSGAGSIRRVGGAIIRRGRLIINGVQDGFAGGLKKVKDLLKRLRSMRFRGFSMSRKGIFYILWGHFNPKVMVAGGIVEEDITLAGTGVRPRLGADIPMPGRRKPGIVIGVFDDGSKLSKAIDDMSASQRKALWKELQEAPDEAARRTILNRILGNTNDLPFPTTTEAMRKAVQGKPYVDPFDASKTVKPPSGTVMSPDHVFPVSKIKELDGFKQLTPAQQKIIVQDVGKAVDNIQPLPKSLNESKGNLTGGNWTHYNGQPLDPAYIKDLAARQAAAKQRIEAKIAEFLQQNG